MRAQRAIVSGNMPVATMAMLDSQKMQGRAVHRASVPSFVGLRAWSGRVRPE